MVAAPKDDCRTSLISSEMSTDTASRIPLGVYSVVESGLAACAAGLKVTGIVGVGAALVSTIRSIYPSVQPAQPSLSPNTTPVIAGRG